MSRVKKVPKFVKQVPRAPKTSEYVFSWDTVYVDIRKRVGARRQLAERLHERDVIDIGALMPFLKNLAVEVDSGMSKVNREVTAGLLEAIVRHPCTQRSLFGSSDQETRFLSFWPLTQRKALLAALVECGALTALLEAPPDRYRTTLMRALSDKFFDVSSYLHIETVQKLYASTDLTITISASAVQHSDPGVTFKFQAWLPLLLNLAANNRLFVAVSTSAPFQSSRICWPAYGHELRDWTDYTKLAMHDTAALFVLALLFYVHGKFSSDVTRLLSPRRALHELAFVFLARLREVEDSIAKQHAKVVEYTGVALDQKFELSASYNATDQWVDQAMSGKCLATIENYLSSLRLRQFACQDHIVLNRETQRLTKNGLRACLFAAVVALQQSVVLASTAPLAVYLVRDILLLARDPYVVYAYENADADERAFVLAHITRACGVVQAIYRARPRQPAPLAPARLASELAADAEHQVKRARQVEPKGQE